MMVRIITDTASDLEASEYKMKGVEYIPLTITFGEQSYVETNELDKENFYRLLTQSGEFPKTAQPSPLLLAEKLGEAKQCGDEVVCIFLSSSLSGLYQSAFIAKQLADMEQCYIIDSGTAAAGQRLLVDYAVNLRAAGKSACEISSELELIGPRVSIYACLDTLEYLYRGGRISKEKKILGTVLNIKPILSFRHGKLTLPAKVRGIKRGIRTICDFIDADGVDTKYPVLLMYTNLMDNGMALMSELRTRKYPVAIRNIFNAGAAIGSHIGPSACGVAFIRSN